MRKRAGDRLSAALAKDLTRAPQVRLPTLESPDPAQIVRDLATRIEPHLATIVGPSVGRTS